MALVGNKRIKKCVLVPFFNSFVANFQRKNNLDNNEQNSIDNGGYERNRRGLCP